MLFDLSIYGHHPTYIRYLINYWQENELSGSLDIVVIPKFLEVHGEVVELLEKKPNFSIKFVSISLAEAANLNFTKSSFKRNIRYFQEWAILCKYARLLSATHCLAMYFDTYQLPLFLGSKPPCQVSGIYFKPTFHYQYLTPTSSNWKQKLQEFREKFILANILKNLQLSTLFSLDNYVIKYLDRFPNAAKVIPLPDPIATTQVKVTSVDNLRERLGIDPNIQIFLVFGALTPRKGISELLEAISLLSEELCDRFCLLLVGEASLENQTQFLSQIANLQQQKPIQIISHFEFVGESEVPIYFQLADLVLAPYQRHVGMSGILLLAAAAGKPVLSSDYGLMGQVVREYQLGMVVDAGNPEAIAQGLTKFLLHSGDVIGDRSQMSAFVAANSAERFAEVIFHRILSHES
ncbi:glycosyl transferase family 1 [Merismopedia glauca CCAP 1448/3]|uniref:Glycosyl transferase family 1 n=2 Tax=Merismopedia TaxID=53402 RepID=A0A2T1C5H8_9CYAN|nr:glycosyl transferase family 1 [Merismopedia glauca CCAP 1448/3]